MESPSASRGIGSILTATALVLVLGSNLLDINRVHVSLQSVQAQQLTQIETARKAEAQLDSLAKGLQSLAAAGNPNAQAVVDALARNGVQINASSARSDGGQAAQ